MSRGPGRRLVQRRTRHLFRLVGRLEICTRSRQRVQEDPRGPGGPPDWICHPTIQYGMVADVIPQPVLNPRSEVPLYRQLHHYYMDLIRSGSLAQGERLPATRELAGLLGLNRTTVSAAYEILESEGLISGQVGRGSFVTGGVESAAGGERVGRPGPSAAWGSAPNSG